MNLQSDLSGFSKVAVIMAGGTNMKLWPKSTEKTPKQFLSLIDDRSMLENTVLRLMPFFEPQDIYIVTSEEYYTEISSRVPAVSKDNIICEPFAKNTAPCLALSLTILREKYPEDTVFMAFPADHAIQNVVMFHNSLDIAAQAAYQTNNIVTIGIQPSRPETGFGYIQVTDDKSQIEDFYDFGVRKSSAFAEKPDLETAKRFLDSGDFLWNSGIFIMRIDKFWNLFQKFLPEHFKLFEILGKTIGQDVFREAVRDAYMQMEAVSMDYAIMEKARNFLVLESMLNWSDVGNWDEIYRLSMKDGRNNVLIGNVMASNVRNTFVMSDERFIGIVGIDNLIVVDTNDSLFICKKGETANVQEIIDYLKRKQLNHLL
jgi:mannose-1-phosphate guanylyltransferase